MVECRKNTKAVRRSEVKTCRFAASTMKTLKGRRPLPRTQNPSEFSKRMSTSGFFQVEYLGYFDHTAVFWGRRRLAAFWNEGLRGKEQWELNN